MPSRIDWESQIGRRLRLRDLYVFSTVVRTGSMGKAAQELGISQPAVSEVIANLEYALGVRLLDRTPQGAKITVHGAALDRRVLAAFDELKQGVKEIEFLSDPTAGEVRIGCPESISAAILQPICETLMRQYPRIALDVDTVNTLSFAQKLRNRSLDIVLARGGWPLEDAHLVTDFNVETLYEDELVIVAGDRSDWAARRKINISDLRDERWILTSSDRWNYQVIAAAFKMRGVEMPQISLKTISVPLRAHMVATGSFITTFPRSVVDRYAGRLGLKILPVDLPNSIWPIKIATLKNRTLSSVVERFIHCARETARPAAKTIRAHKSIRAK